MNSNANAIDITISNTAANRCLDVAFLNHSIHETHIQSMKEIPVEYH